jgi:topoisomerase-4 subunit A
MGRNFIEYASYVIIDRAIPDILDGLKPVQRRILATLSKMDDGKFHKVANVIGDTMKLHPHGDASIGDALVVLANKDYFIEKQGNFGNPITGHAPAAARYIECRLTDLAKETLFRKALTEYRPSYDGRNEEPVALPAKLPVLLMLGAEGIAVGMSTRILPYNLPELLQAQIKILQNEPFEIFPDFPTGGIVDVTDYDDGHGKVKVRARLEKRDEKTVVVREIAFGTTTESLIASIESAAQKGKVKIGAINDFTTDRVEIEIELSRGVYANEVIPQLYAHTE